MKFLLKITYIVIILVSSVYSKSEVDYPKDWKTFSSVETPLTLIGSLPGCDADVSALSEIYQETIATYCAAKPGGPGEIAVLTNNIEAYKNRNGIFKDGSVSVFHLVELKVLFVTQWKNNSPYYGIFTEDGQDASNTRGSGLHPQDCRSCHTGYKSYCFNGQCSSFLKTITNQK